MQEENYGRMNLASQTDENSVDAWDEAFEEELEEEPKEKKHLLKKSGQMVTVLQIGLCGLILLAAFLLRLAARSSTVLTVRTVGRGAAWRSVPLAWTWAVRSSSS